MSVCKYARSETAKSLDRGNPLRRITGIAGAATRVMGRYITLKIAWLGSGYIIYMLWSLSVMAVVLHAVINSTLNLSPWFRGNINFGNQAGSDRIRKYDQQDPIESYLFQTMVCPSILAREKGLRYAKQKEYLHCVPAGVRCKRNHALFNLVPCGFGVAPETVLTGLRDRCSKWKDGSGSRNRYFWLFEKSLYHNLSLEWTARPRDVSWRGRIESIRIGRGNLESARPLSSLLSSQR